MCGIVGFVDKNISEEHGRCIVTAMHNSIAYRGPDDFGTWINDGVYFGHRRLSIIDTSIAGHQPMISKSGRFVIIFNGEIYNHEELRKLHSEAHWIGHSDTETLLACVEKWGVAKTLECILGMFAFVLWDRLEYKMYLARDRAGEKPLYYGVHGNVLFFASEIKPFLFHPSFKREIDPDALEAYVRKGFVPAPYSIFKGIKKVRAGTYLTIDLKQNHNISVAESEYWSIEKVASQRLIYEKDLVHAVSDLDNILRKAVSQQLISDVPIGAFLSGGIDSSLIVSLMQAISSKPVKTFTIGFDVESFNEAKYAKRIAEYLGTSHTELYISETDALNILPKLANIYSEPFADVSQIPTTFVSKLAKTDVTVVLSGDGGDELFCGYGRYDQAVRFWRKLSKIPYSVRSLLSKVQVHPFIEGAKSKTIDDFYHFMNKQWKGYERIVYDANEYYNYSNNTLKSDVERMMLYDFLEYLPDDILVKVDRAAMSQSLETRVPLLDKNVIEFAWSLPLNYKQYNGINKWPLKQMLYKYLPVELVDRPKMGFGVPLDNWLRNTLNEWASELLSINSLDRHNLLNSKLINKCWIDYVNGKHNRHSALWAIIVFQEWYEKLNDYKPVV